jgi:anti-sigma B factor antagonist
MTDLAERATTDRPADRDEDRPHDGIQRVVARGDIDVASAGQLRQELLAVIDAGARIVVLDARAVHFLDSSGLRVIVDVSDRLEADGGQLLIEGASAAMHRVLELTGLLEHYRADAST